ADRALQAGDNGGCQLLFRLRAGKRRRCADRERGETDERRGHRALSEPAVRPHVVAMRCPMKEKISATATLVAAVSRRAWYSTIPSLRPRSPIVTRWG